MLCCIQRLSLRGFQLLSSLAWWGQKLPSFLLSWNSSPMATALRPSFVEADAVGRAVLYGQQVQVG